MTSSGSSKRLKLIRKNLWDLNPECFVCRGQIENYKECSVEHILPLSQGGTSKKSNLTISHRWCNSIRGSIQCRIVWEQKLANYSEAFKNEMKKRSKRTGGNLKVWPYKERFKKAPLWIQELDNKAIEIEYWKKLSKRYVTPIFD